MSENYRRHPTRVPAQPKTSGDLGTTVDAFSARLQRRLREQEQHEDARLREREQRQARILQAMNSIRRALQDTGKIKLGRRFHLALEVTDWEGWPRLELNLIDSEWPERVDYGFVVSAHDRNEQGTILMALRSGEPLARLQLAQADEQKRIGPVLKRSVRTFLDLAAEYVLNPVKIADTLQAQTKALPLEDEPDPLSRKLQGEDVFCEDWHDQRENRVEELPDAVCPLDVDLSKHK